MATSDQVCRNYINLRVNIADGSVSSPQYPGVIVKTLLGAVICLYKPAFSSYCLFYSNLTSQWWYYLANNLVLTGTSNYSYTALSLVGKVGQPLFDSITPTCHYSIQYAIQPVLVTILLDSSTQET